MLKTPRLIFRHFFPADLNQLYQEIYSHPLVAQALSPTGSLTFEQTAQILHRRLDHWQKHGFGVWALIHKQNQQLMGHCGLHYLGDTSEVELTYAINPFYWRQGLATEAARAVLHWGFDTLKLKQIVAVTGPENIASRRVMQKLGMRYEQNIEYGATEVFYYSVTPEAFESELRLSRQIFDKSARNRGNVAQNR
ncbi:MAG: GNAT family N-acetyltransferase [Leptolyngbyaceae cyanobacterium SM1_4_3]|nr:GNAT family N-acetyltransferase [Leptolyngbyaceae cyanobacterium SM1_4_3]NJN89344.1 GNAT family N-acetyltransferase [Leptolyngbyaceae cyanobacterium SL_5_14]